MRRLVRWLFLAWTAVGILFFCSSCRSTNDDWSAGAIAARLREEIEFPALSSVKTDNLDAFFNVDRSRLRAFEAYVSKEEGKADELAVFEAVSEKDVSEIMRAVSLRVNEKAENFGGAPREYAKLQNSLLRVKGRFVILVVCAEHDKAAKFLDSIGAAAVAAVQQKS